MKNGYCVKCWETQQDVVYKIPCPIHDKKEIEDWQEMKEDLRDEFEDLFPKDQEAIDGIRPSKSHRSEALVLWAYWEIILKAAISQTRLQILKEVKEGKICLNCGAKKENNLSDWCGKCLEEG